MKILTDDSAMLLGSHARTRAVDSKMPAWERYALVALLAVTACLYLWDLGASGWANTYYSAAVQAGTKSWKAFLFGSFDSSNFVTVDKSPGALWPMEISARIFGVNSWSILAPQAVMGVATVGVLYATVRRWFGAAAGLIAGAALALTPIATLMFRFNNPDAMLVVCLTASAYALTRAIENGSTKWIAITGGLIGAAFLAKMMQAFLVVPGFALVYLVAAPGGMRTRIVQLLKGGLALAVSAGWWIALVVVTPSSWRPYVGGSQNNSILNLLFGYNGFGRLSGNESGSVVGGGQTTTGGGGMWGATGIGRLFSSEMGSQIAWLLPAALIMLAFVLVTRGRARRNDKTRTAMLLWGSWLVFTGLTFSYGAGIIHPYYTVALAPAIAAIVGIGAVHMWKHRERFETMVALAVVSCATAIWAYVLLGRADWHPWLRDFVLVGGFGTGIALVALPYFKTNIAKKLAGAALVFALIGPAAYSLQTASTAHSGSLPTAGPSSGNGFGPGGAGGQRGPGNFGGGMGGFGGGGGAGGGLLEGSTPTSELTSYLKQNDGNYKWVAATVRANQAAGYQLATDDAVMAIGGFNGTDPAPSLAQFKTYVAEGKIHYFVASSGGGVGNSSSDTSDVASEITAWVESNFSSQTVGGVAVYDLTTTSTSSTAV